jgi:uncharacterized protein (TIGR02678 family)
VTDERVLAERRDAVRALLARPIAGADDGDVLALARRHRAELSAFFADELGYRFDASRPALVRVAKAHGPGHVSRGLRTRSGKRFDRRRYALVCLVLAALERAGERTTAARLFEEVSTRAAGIDGLAFDADVAADRRAFVQAVQAIESLGVLELAEGDEERFARGEAGCDALYRVDRERLGLLPAVVQPPSLASSPEGMLEEPYPDTDEGRTRRRRHRVMRALVEQPVVYVDDLDEGDVDYLTRQRARIERVLRDWVGLDLEVRAEGWVAVDFDGGLSDVSWPDYGTAETTALRLCDELRARRLRHDTKEWPADDVVAFVHDLAAEYAGSWRQSADTGKGAADLAAEAIEILRSLRLAWTDADRALVARPAAARFAARATAASEEECP